MKAAYKEHVYKKCNVGDLKIFSYIPREENNTGIAIVWIHGGGMKSGDAKDYISHSRYFAERGIAGLSVEYRLLQEHVSLEDCIQDVKDAICYIRQSAQEFRIDKEKIVVVGESAGAYLACGLVTAFNNGESSREYLPNAVVNCNGVVDITEKFIYFLEKYPFARPDMITEDMRNKAMTYSPIFQMKENMPPCLNLQGLQDIVVLPEITKNFHEKYKTTGAVSKLVCWEDAKHAFLVPNYTATVEQIERALKEIENFIFELW